MASMLVIEIKIFNCISVDSYYFILQYPQTKDSITFSKTLLDAIYRTNKSYWSRFLDYRFDNSLIDSTRAE